MDDFTLQRSVFRHIAKTRPSFDQGIKYVLGRISEAPHGSLWTPCVAKAPKLLAGMLDSWVAWMDRLDKTMPLPENTEVLWFEVPSELNPALTSVSAYDTLGPASEAYGMDEPRTWPENEDGTTHESGLWSMPQLDQLLALAGWGSPNSDVQRRLRPGVYALHYAATALLVLNGLPRTLLAKRLSKQPKGLSATVGWASGDCDALGTLTGRSWQKLRRATPIHASPTPYQLDIESLGFDARKFLAAGGDPNACSKAGDPVMIAAMDLDVATIRALKAAGADFRATGKNGWSVLFRHWTSDLRILRELLASGADPNAKANNGMPVLYQFSSRDWAVVKMLIDHGANPNARYQGTFLDSCIGYASIPIHGLEALWRMGVRFSGSFEPVCRVVSRGFILFPSRKAVRDRIRFCIRHGHSLQSPPARPPLWTCLLHHADEIVEMQRKLKGILAEFGRIVGTWDYQYDTHASILLELGANPNARHAPGHSSLVPANATPLMVQRYDDDKLVKALLKHGADPTLKSAEGKSALDYARRAQKRKDRLANVGVDAVVKQLERAEAKWTGKPAKPGK
jgi:hypothetical protein